MNISELRDVRMISDPLAVRLARHADKLPATGLVLDIVRRREGGQLTSVSLRSYLERVHDIRVGSYSYGSLLEPGRSDRGLTIGRYVSIGPNVRRFGAAHPTGRLSMHPYWYNPALRVAERADDVDRSRCIIDHEAWIGANVTILPSCERIGIGAVIGAGAVVTRDVPDFGVVLGVPGKQKAERLPREVQAALLEAQPWLEEPSEAGAKLREIAISLGDVLLFAPSAAT